MFLKTGVKDEGLMFLFTEGQIKTEGFLVFLNDLLSSGEIADLFVAEDIDGILTNLGPAAKSDGLQVTPANVWNYFIGRVKRNLHMALCMSPSDSFRSRARKFPAIINCTVIDWFHPWPQDALLSVAAKQLEEVEMASDEERKAIIDFMPFSFGTVNDYSALVYAKEKRHIYTTPKSFLELIALFKSMLASKRALLVENREKYDKGVLKLQETGEQVAELEENLKVTSVVVEEKKKHAAEQAEIVGGEKAKVEISSNTANVESAKCAVIATQVAAQMEAVTKDLAAAIPALEAAEGALNGLNVKQF
jgi:dynein heavy chain